MKLNFETAKSITLKYNLFVLGTFTLAAVVVWVGYSLYDTYMRSTIEPEVQNLLRPLDPSIDLSVIEQLQERRQPPLEFTITAIEGTGNDQRTITINSQGGITQEEVANLDEVPSAPIQPSTNLESLTPENNQSTNLTESAQPLETEDSTNPQ